MPAEHCGRQVLGGMAEEAVAGQFILEFFITLFDLHFALLLAGPFGREEVGRRQLHLVADDNDLLAAEQRRNCLFERNLARLVENDHVHEVNG